MIYLGINGTIELLNYENNYNQFWNVHADCEQVNIFSNIFETEASFDSLEVDGVYFSGSVLVDLILGSDFIVSFVSNERKTMHGFSLVWECYKGEVTSGLKQFQNELLST